MKTKTFKRTIAVLMAVLIACSSVGISLVLSTAADANNYIIVDGSAVADPNTSAIKDGFKVSNAFTKENDGKILADKTVKYKGDDYTAFTSYDNDEFGVELSALAQSYTSQIRSKVQEEGEIHPDVIFVIDVSGSMNNNGVTDDAGNTVFGTRTEAVVFAMNNAVNLLMDADPQTRIGAVCFGSKFGGSGSSGEGKGSDTVYLPIDTYTPPEGSTEYFFFDEEASTTTIQVPDSYETMKVKLATDGEMWLYPDSGTHTTEEYTERTRIKVYADGHYEFYAANATTATRKGVVGLNGTKTYTKNNGTRQAFDIEGITFYALRGGTNQNRTFTIYDAATGGNSVTVSNGTSRSLTIDGIQVTFAYASGSTFTATVNSGNSVALNTQYTLVRVGNYYYVYDTAHNATTTTITDIPDERQAFTTDGGDTFYATNLNGNVINIYVSNTAATPVATLTEDDPTDEYTMDDCDYSFEWVSATGFKVKSEGMADVYDSFDIQNTTRKSYTVNGTTLYALSTAGKIEFYTVLTGGSPIVTLTEDSPTANCVINGAACTFTRTGANSATEKNTHIGTQNVTNIGTNKTSFTVNGTTLYAQRNNGSTRIDIYRNQNDQNYFTRLQDGQETYTDATTGFTFTRTGGSTMTVTYPGKVSSTITQSNGTRTARTSNGVTFYAVRGGSYRNYNFTIDDNNGHSVTISDGTSGDLTIEGIPFTFTYASGTTFTATSPQMDTVSITDIAQQAKTTCSLSTGDTIYAFVSDGTMKIYTSADGSPVKTIGPGKSETITYNNKTYKIINNNNESLDVMHHEDVDKTSTVNGFPAKKEVTLGNGKKFYITAQGAPGSKTIKLYASANAVTPVATSSSGRFTYDSVEYAVQKNSDSSIDLSYLTARTGSATKTMTIPSTVGDGQAAGETNHVIAINKNMTNSQGQAAGTHAYSMGTNGTYTQAGLAGALDMFNDVTDTSKRVPIIVLVSDGDPTYSHPDYRNPGTTYDTSGGNSQGSSTTATDAYRTAMTAIYVKQQVDAHYPENDAKFYSIGPGVTDTIGMAVLYPGGKPKGKEDDPTEKTYFQKCQNSTATNASGFYTQMVNEASTNPDIDLDYVNHYTDWGLVGNLTADDLANGFRNTVQLIKDIPRPITEAEIDYTETHTHMVDGKNMVFVDTIGNGMGLSFINDDGTYTLADAPVLRYCSDTGTKYPATSCTKEAVDGGYVYKLNYNYTINEASSGIPKDLGTIEVNVYAYTNGNQMVEWKIPADLVPAISIDTETGAYIDTDPVRLIYQVHLTTEASGTYYTNSTSDTATCVFVPALGNPHYYETELDTNENIISNFVYTGEDDGKNKTTNTTGTKTFAWDYETDEASGYGVIIQTLGNNGKISILSKEVAPDSVVIDYGIPVKVNVKVNDGLSGSITGIAKTVAAGTVLNSTAYSASRLGSDKVGKNTDLALTYGTAKLDNDGNVTYTLDTSKGMKMPTAETLYYEFTTTGGQIYYSTLTIIPATTIYYEDSFVTFTGDDWGTEGTLVANALQHEDRAGAEDANVYGYDGAYKTMETYSLGQSHKITVSATNTNKDGAEYATFSFTGTAFDVISVTSGDTGTVNCIVTDSSNKTVGDWVVDTYYGYDFNEDQYYMNVWQFSDDAWHRIMQEAIEEEDIVDYGETIDLPIGENGADVAVEAVKKLPAATEAEDGDTYILYSKSWEASERGTLYQIPVIKSPTLAYGTYTVKITPVYSRFFDNAGDGDYDFYLDAVRIYDPADPDATGNDSIADAYDADNERSPRYLELKNVITAGTYKDDSTTGVLFLDGYTDTDLSDGVGTYSNFGPNNEVYLAKGNSIAFQVNDANHDSIASVQIAARIFEDSDNSGKTTTNAETYTLTDGTKTKFSINGIDFWAQRTGSASPYSFNIYETATATTPLATLTSTATTSTKNVSGTSITFTYKSNTTFTAAFTSKTNFTVVATDEPAATVKSGKSETIKFDGTKFSFAYVSENSFSATHSGTTTRNFTKTTPGRSSYDFDGVTFYAERGENTDGKYFRIYTKDISSTVLPANNEEYSSATDLYYDITPTFKSTAFKGNLSPVIIIANTGEGKISITNIKITYNVGTDTNEEEPSLAPLSPNAVEEAIYFANDIYMYSIVACDSATGPEAVEPDNTDSQETDPAVPSSETDDENTEKDGILGFLKNLFEKIVSFFITAYNYIKFNLSILY